MTTTSTKPRKLLQFRLRTFLLLPILVATYFALEWPTKRFGIGDVSERITAENNGNEIHAAYHSPLLLTTSHVTIERIPGKPDLVDFWIDYYFWIFGFTAKLPYQTNTSILITKPSDTSEATSI